MIVDSSALVAVVLREAPVVERLLDVFETWSGPIGVGAPTFVESRIVLEARLGADGAELLTRLAAHLDLTVVAFTADHATVALDAWRSFGRGRHAASLNFGDCLAYATARLADRPLLCVGDDFPKTDIRLVPLPV